MFDKEYIFYGKHAIMVKKLTGKLNDLIGKGFFKTNYDLYLLAPIVGWVYKRTAVVEKTGETTKVFADKIVKQREELMFTFRTIMLLCNGECDNEDVIHIAFRLDDKDEERKPYEDIYNSYVLGGIEEIYEQIFEKNHAKSIDEYMMNLYEFMEDLKVRLYGDETISSEV